MMWKSGVSPPASRTSNHWAQQTKSPELECSSSTMKSPRLRFRDISSVRRYNRQKISLIGPLQFPTFAALRRHELLRGLRVGHLEIRTIPIEFLPRARCDVAQKQGLRHQSREFEIASRNNFAHLAGIE